MASQQRPDDRLQALLSEAGWTGQDLAREVNELGAESGLELRYDRTSVAHWLAGSRPNQPVPELIAEVFSRRLRRRVPVNTYEETPPESAPAESGLVPAGADSGSAEFEADPVTRLVELNAGRRRLAHGGVYSLATLSVPRWAQATTAPHPSLTQETGRVSRDEAEGAQAMGRVFSDADIAFGSGQSVAALAAYLAHDIAPKLRARAAPTVRRTMFGAATELTYLCAFMYFDQEKYAAAQRYHTIALKLAADSHDPVGYATTLRAMSVQAHHLGHHAQALDLAESALSTTPASIPPKTRAFLYGQAAVAAAAVGDKRTALSHLGKAEAFLERSSGDDPTVGAYHQAALAHQHAAVLSALGDVPGAVRALSASIRHRPATERRSRAITLAALAELQLRQGHLELSAATWQHFLHDYPHLKSERVTTAFTTMRRTLRPHQHHPAIAQLWALAADLRTQAAKTRAHVGSIPAAPRSRA